MSEGVKIKINKMEVSGAHGVVTVQGFTVMQVKFSARSKAAHHLYIKEHAVRETSSCKPKDRTLFVVGVPPYCDEECFQRLFSDCGKVQHVYFHKSPTSDPPLVNTSKYFPEVTPVQGFKVAYVVFKSPGSIAKAKRIPFDKVRTLSSEDHPLMTGLRKWRQKYQGPGVDTAELQAEIDEFMTKFDQKQEEELQKAKENEGVADEDGWVTVTRHGKNKGAPRTEVHEKRVTAKERKKRKEKELLNFYSFQVRESKMEHIADLRRKFEEDKQKIALMKQARKFRPY